MLARPAFTVRPEVIAFADARARRLGLNRSAYVRAGLALLADATDEEVVAAAGSLPSRRSEAETENGEVEASA